MYLIGSEVSKTPPAKEVAVSAELQEKFTSKKYIMQSSHLNVQIVMKGKGMNL